MSNNMASSSMDRSEAPLSPVVWRRLFMALVIGAIIEFFSRIFSRLDIGNDLFLQSFSLLAAILVAVTIVILVSCTCQNKYLTSVMVIAAIAIIFSGLLHLTAVFPQLDALPLLGRNTPYRNVITGIADIIGIAAWLFGFFGLVFEIQHARWKLDQQHSLLVSEIKEREHAEQRLQESEALFRAIFERVDGAIVVLNEKGGILQCNSTFCQGLGVEFLDLRGTKIDAFLAEEDRLELLKNMKTVSLQHAVSHRGEYPFRYHDGSTVWFSVAITAIAQHEKTGRTLVAIMENQTARREREERILHQKKLESIGLLAGGIAHEFNNLFVGVMANAELLTRGLTEDSKKTAICNDIVTSTQRATVLCKQLLAYAGKAPLKVQPLDLSQVVQASHSLLQMALPRNATLGLEYEDKLPAVQADPSQIRQLLLNLLSNASDALQGAAGELRIATRRVTLSKDDLDGAVVEHGSATPGNYVSLVVSDTGIGIPENSLKQLFDPFYTTKELGSGLGLAAVQGIIRANGGVLSITSNPGEGTVVQAHFPATSKQAEPLPEAPAPAPAPTSCTIAPSSSETTVLLVEDDEMVLAGARRVLEYGGYRVLVARDGQEGVELFQKNHDLLSAVLLDLVMPVMNGETACLKMRAIDPGVPIIISSGYSEADTEIPGSLSHVSRFVCKPYRIQTLLDAVSEVIEHREQGR